VTRRLLALVILGSLAAGCASAPAASRFRLSRADYADRVHAAWLAQIAATLMGFQFEHKVASTAWVDRYPQPLSAAPVDDDWYYEMCAVRAFEKHGIGMTVRQLGEQWKENACGTWGSSKMARELLLRGVQPPDTGHPRYNRAWFTIGPQFSADVYGLVAPGMPNLAGRLAREFGHLNGYAEGADGAVFMAGMVSLAFAEKDPRTVVRKAARLIHPDSPYRKAVDSVVAMAEAGRTAREIADAVEDRWHIEYPATNNAVGNGALAAIGVWFGEGDFLKTVNVVYRAADFTDADCNAANAAAVVAAMRGTACLPRNLVEPLQDRIRGTKMGDLTLTPPVDEKISDLGLRTASVGERMIAAHGARIDGDLLEIAIEEPVAQSAELFRVGDLVKFWNPEWTLERAGHGAATGGLQGLRGSTYLDGEVLVTYPRDEVRGVVLRREASLGAASALRLEVAADMGKAWELRVYAGNARVHRRVVEGGPGARAWQDVNVDLAAQAGRKVELRLYQLVLLPGKVPGNAYWRSIEIR
jgi:hypothetical protein